MEQGDQVGVEDWLVDEPEGQDTIHEWLYDVASGVVRFACCSSEGSGCDRNMV